ncbi:GNAT family N-acetyltransferase [Winogradskyella flava]|uniref:GNAT family N-acetyltransferase n=1 Tax=Winogradskyella flava TaxID=1884876 RepID=A0A842IN68_9FLAO|nr:GNAT family N-acetyltransferase [Winogradskyella flava]MBC2844105.1 GNAT family N-acetyltransferase [Winogradskyella flava]
MPITIRKAVIEDSRKLSILYKQVYIKTYGTDGVSDEFANFIVEQFSVSRIEKTIASNPNHIIVAEYKNNLIGVLEIEFDKKCHSTEIIAPELNKLYILEWFCNTGVGEKLLKEAERTLISLNIKQYWLWVLDSNLRAISFYKKHSFKIVGRAPFTMEENTYNNIVMIKKL